jgi:hypothetical protein
MDIKAGAVVHGAGRVEGNLESLLEYLQRFDLFVTRRLLEAQLGEMIKEFAAAPADAKVTAEQATKLSEAMVAIRNTLEAEARGKVAWIASDKRYAIEKLMNNMGSLMAPGIFNSLPPIARFDFDQAGKLIAFEFSTAAAFHLLRGTEDVFRAFYRSVVKQKRVSPLLWGPMVTHMRKRAKPPSSVLLNDLDSIRVTFRNPTDHPELVYDIEGVQDLLNRCIEVVNRMSSEGHL